MKFVKNHNSWDACRPALQGFPAGRDVVGISHPQQQFVHMLVRTLPLEQGRQKQIPVACQPPSVLHIHYLACFFNPRPMAADANESGCEQFLI